MYKYGRTLMAVAVAAAGIGVASAQEIQLMSSDPARDEAPSRPDAQGNGSMQGMDHGSMQGMDHGSMQGMDHGSMQGMDHGSMQGMDHGSMQGMDHGSMQGMDHGSMQGMDHGSMQMQGGSPPPDARDPHGYSDGYQLGAGKFALGNGRQLMMADEHNFASVLVDRLEWSHGPEANATSYEAQAWFGTVYNKAVIKAEGDIQKGKVEEARTELLWGHAIATFWDTQVGLRNDAGNGRPARNWAAFGVQGLAPYRFNVQATAYLGDSGRTAFRLSTEYELLLTQRLILQPRLEANFYGKRDTALEIGSGLSSGTLGVRLRYEFSRQFAPYIGIERSQAFGSTANMIEAAGGRRGETRVIAGVRVWY
ncbi:Copper resistance protein B [Ralstonia mannitolilytica]|uniref:copper resistance protein B n=1 Tax=Ralstonia mannitolilytica TaxID=105219 RepID=UPI0007AFF922|nr:copper resistance protein B [Ralstonia mannitolilytica]ANA35751.1 copper resistance protein CopB [Ralstonia mannitolilytica]CAJ0687073.1 Copper resistance protein B [Ralstonia mannitolilytica]CAJ0804623.1 Copper resistance protein B [Ralstonia mannitolilytica]